MQYGETLLCKICDARNQDSIEKSVAEFYDLFQKIDIAIHNACVYTFNSAANAQEDEYQNIFNVNYFGALRLVKSTIPYMQKHNKGKIIFTSSCVGVMGFNNISPYASSKGALESLAKCLALNINLMESPFIFFTRLLQIQNRHNNFLYQKR